MSSIAEVETTNATRLKNILDATFQANPAYELVVFENLPAGQQELFADLKKDPEFYGLLQPKPESKLGIKSACRETALLFMKLRRPGVLPAFVTEQPEANQAIAELVLDGVLTLQKDGAMVTGAQAFEAICEPGIAEAPKSSIAELSRAALEYAQSLPVDDVNRVSTRLYSYNRIPVSPAWRQLFPGKDAVARVLAVDPDGVNARLLSRDWTQLDIAPTNEVWLSWQSRHPVFSYRRTAYKLYISPHPGSIRRAFDALVSVAARGGPVAFKVGRDVQGILRPDKLVVYFATREALQATAQELSRKLEGCPAQGVPFTAQIGDTALLSWGIDPPEEMAAPPWMQRESWRLWVTNRLAVALLMAKSSDQPVDCWRFAVERLRLDGVDTGLWTPKESGGEIVSKELASRKLEKGTAQ